MSEQLRRVAASNKSVDIRTSTTVSDIDRILALPKRQPIDCERDPRTGQYQPLTQALIEVMTERFSRPRLSCACRERRAVLLVDGTLAVSRIMPEGTPPDVPLLTTVEKFLADLQPYNAFDQQITELVRGMKTGDEVLLPAADGRSHPCIRTLNAVQSWLLYEAEQSEGAVGFCGVGSGKSMAFLLAALLFPWARLAVLLIEPKQRQHYRSQYVRLREHFRVPTLVPDDGFGYTVPGTTPLHLVSYSVLSQMQNSDLLDTKDPDVLLGDEFHRACGNSAVNRRVKRYAADRIRRREEALARGEKVPRRALTLIGASGTLESGSIEDTQMVCAFSLGMGSPLPIDPEEAKRWTQVIDPVRQPDRKSKTAKMLHQVFAGTTIDDDDFSFLVGTAPESKVREGFRRRRLLTPGIISASASSVNATIFISEREAPKMPMAVRDALMRVRTENIRPDGEYLAERVEQIAAARNVACGFYNYWAFPAHPCTCTDVKRCDQCILIDDWYARRKEFNKALRGMLLGGYLNLDSPKLCEDAAERFYQQPPYKGVLPTWACAEWPAWRDIRDRVKYEEREKWIANGGEFLVQDAAKWATENKGVVWFQSIVFGRRLSELTGLPYYNGGPGAEQRMRAEKGDRSIICSIKAHGAGTDGLQNIFNKQLIAETPASNSKQTGYEQLLGRLHREGQPKPEVFTELYGHVRELKDAFIRAYEQAEFNFEMTGNRQKLLMSDIDIDWFSRRGFDDDDE